jgi:hypothetical protein
MKPQFIHAQEDRLLDFAYGELQPSEAQLVEQHVEGCSRCAEALADIRGVRTSMSRLSLEPAPDAGLESLLAYAQQSARRAAAGPVPQPSWWRRWLVPAVGVAAVSVFGLVVHRVSTQVEPMSLSPHLPLEAKKDVAGKEAAANLKEEAPAPAFPAVAQAPKQAPTAQPPAEAVALHAQRDEEFRLAQEKTKGVRRRGSRSEDWSNVGSGGGFPAKKRESYAALDEDRRDTLAASESPRAEADDSLAGVSVDLEGNAPQQVARAEPAATPKDEAEAPVLPGQSQQAVTYEESRGRGQQQGRTSSSLGPVASSRPASPEAAMPSAPPPPAVAAAPEGFADKAPAAANPAPARTAPSKLKQSAPESPAELSRQAREASRGGDRSREASLLRMALADARGSERLDLLSRLCEAEVALGRRDAALEACNQVVAEDPDSRAASLARRRLEQL